MSEIIKDLLDKQDHDVIVRPNIVKDNIPDNAVESSKIADNAVTTAKINAAAVTNAKIADNAIGSSKISSQAVTTGKIDNAAVTTAKIADGAVNTAKIADNAIATAKIANGAVTDNKLYKNVYLDTADITIEVSGVVYIFELQITANTTLANSTDFNDLLDFLNDNFGTTAIKGMGVNTNDNTYHSMSIEYYSTTSIRVRIDNTYTVTNLFTSISNATYIKLI